MLRVKAMRVLHVPVKVVSTVEGVAGPPDATFHWTGKRPYTVGVP